MFPVNTGKCLRTPTLKNICDTTKTTTTTTTTTTTKDNKIVTFPTLVTCE